MLADALIAPTAAPPRVAVDPHGSLLLLLARSVLVLLVDARGASVLGSFELEAPTPPAPAPASATSASLAAAQASKLIAQQASGLVQPDFAVVDAITVRKFLFVLTSDGEVGSCSTIPVACTCVACA